MDGATAWCWSISIASSMWVSTFHLAGQIWHLSIPSCFLPASQDDFIETTIAAWVWIPHKLRHSRKGRLSMDYKCAAGWEDITEMAFLKICGSCLSLCTPWFYMANKFRNHANVLGFHPKSNAVQEQCRKILLFWMFMKCSSQQTPGHLLLRIQFSYLQN